MFGSIIRSSILSAAASASSYLLLITLARNGGVEFAAFNFAVVCGLVLVMIIDVAAEQAASHFMVTAGDSAESALRGIFALKMVMGTAIAVLIGIAAVIDDDPAVPPQTIFFLVPAFYAGPLFELRNRNAEFATILALEKLLLLIGCYAYLSFRGFDLGIYVVHVVVSVASCSVQWPRIGFSLARTFPVHVPLVVDYARRYWPVYVSLFAQAAYGHASRLIIEARRGLMVFASVSLALQTLNALSIAQSQVDRHFRPALNAAAAARDAGALAVLWWKYAAWYVLPLAVCAYAIGAFATPIVGALFGEHWRSAAKPLEVMAPLIVTIPILRFVDTIAVSIGVQRSTLLVNIAAATILIVLLMSLSVERPLADWLRCIVIVQVLHAAIGGLVVVRALRSVPPRPSSGAAA